MSNITVTNPRTGAEETHEVSAVYSGRNGCACGCRGKHSTTQRSVAIVINKIKKFAEQGKGEVDVQPGIYVALHNMENDRLYIAYTDGREA